MHRCLMPSHPLHKMLKEHFRFTVSIIIALDITIPSRFIISIDTLGRQVLIAPDGSADLSLTIGHGSEGVKELNDFLLCKHESFPSLKISSGPHSCEDVRLRRRQCCHVPLLDAKAGKVNDACKECGWDRRMPACPKENSTATSATWKEYRPRGPTSKGNGNQEDLVEEVGWRPGHC